MNLTQDPQKNDMKISERNHFFVKDNAVNNTENKSNNNNNNNNNNDNNNNNNNDSNFDNNDNELHQVLRIYMLIYNIIPLKCYTF